MKDHRCHLTERNAARVSQLLRLGKLHQVQRPGLFGSFPGRIDPTGEQATCQNPANLRIHVDPAFG